MLSLGFKPRHVFQSQTETISLNKKLWRPDIFSIIDLSLKIDGLIRWCITIDAIKTEQYATSHHRSHTKDHNHACEGAYSGDKTRLGCNSHHKFEGLALEPVGGRSGGPELLNSKELVEMGIWFFPLSFLFFLKFFRLDIDLT